MMYILCIEILSCCWRLGLCRWFRQSSSNKSSKSLVTPPGVPEEKRTHKGLVNVWMKPAKSRNTHRNTGLPTRCFHFSKVFWIQNCLPNQGLDCRTFDSNHQNSRAYGVTGSQPPSRSRLCLYVWWCSCQGKWFVMRTSVYRSARSEWVDVLRGLWRYLGPVGSRVRWRLVDHPIIFSLCDIIL